MSVTQLNIKSRITDYTVHFSNSENFLDHLGQNETAIFIVDRHVWDLHKNGVLKFISEKLLILLDVDEKIKNLDTVELLYEKLYELPAKKKLTIVSIGGGITQDLTGFLASTLYRGIKWVYIPTTLLAMADSCIGAKTSLNFKESKNLLGTFFAPNEVYIHPGFLTSLNDFDFLSGIGEIVKLHIIAGEKPMFDFCNHVNVLLDRKNPNILLQFLVKSLEIKKDFIEEDEFDRGRRNILNYGHCIGHAMESSNNYVIPHGQAVVLGIVLANIISKNRQLIDKNLELEIFNKALKPLIKFNLNEINTDVKLIVSGLEKDKKREGQGLPLIIPKNGFEFVKLNDLKSEEIELAMTEFKNRM